MKNTLLWMVVAVLLLGGWWVWDSTTEPLEKNADSQGPEAEHSEVAPAVAPEIAPPLAPERIRLETQPMMEKLEASADQILLTVIHATTGEAIPGMEVLWKEMPTTERIPYIDLDSVLAESGNQGLTNQAGQILLPKNGLNLEVLAQGFGLHGREFRHWKNEAETMVIEAGLDRTVRVFVTYADGRPAEDVVVKYVRIFAPEMSRSPQSARTNAEGLAQLEHIQLSMQGADPNLMQAILVGVPTGEIMQKLFSLIDGPPEEIHFQLPAIGLVKVVMKQADGTLFPDGTEVRLQKKGEISSNNESLLGLDKRFIKDGQALFPVGLNLNLVASTYLQEHRITLTASGEGPTLLGQTVTLNFQQEEEPCFISGRFLQKDGSPLSNAKILGSLNMRNSGQGFRTRTEEDGSFKLSIRDRQFSTDDPYDDGTPYRIAKFAYTLHPGEMWTGQVQLNRTLMPGENEMGDIVLGADILSSGKVVDQFGKPVPEVFLNIRGRSSQLTNLSGKPIDVTVAGSGLYSGPDGRFVLRGTDPVSLLLIHAMRPGYVAKKFELNPGMADQTLMLQKSESWEIQILLDPEIPITAFHASLEVDFGNGKSSMYSLGFKSQDGALTAKIDMLAPGDYTFKLTSATLYEEILSISGIPSGPGIPIDSRLAPLDLRGKIFKRSLHVMGPDGKAPTTYTLATPSRSRGLLLPNDSALYTALESWEVQVWHDSKTQKVVIQQPQTDVYLEEPYLVEVMLDSFPSLRPGSKLWINLTQQENSIHSEHLLDAGKPLLLKLRADGKYDIHFNEKFAEIDSTGSGNQSLRYGPDDQLTLHIDVDPSGELTELHLDGSLLHPKD